LFAKYQVFFAERKVLVVYTSPMTANGWRDILVDISDFAGRDSIISLEIGYAALNVTSVWTGSFFIDNIKAVGGANVVLTGRG
jgi:hypothetical protein